MLYRLHIEEDFRPLHIPVGPPSGGTAQIGFRHSSKPVPVFAVLCQSDRNEEVVIPTTRKRVLRTPISESTPFQIAFRALVRANQQPTLRMRNRITTAPVTMPMTTKCTIAGSIYNDVLFSGSNRWSLFRSRSAVTK
jgi:hypothetical protein